ncbi:hypothetical protein [Massilia aerilata]|uniref:Uncharacterized protein n=1 Tax=Massilia aerilata TaxID=453817 RepID=A0ABW0S6I5_9BURK
MSKLIPMACLALLGTAGQAWASAQKEQAAGRTHRRRAGSLPVSSKPRFHDTEPSLDTAGTERRDVSACIFQCKCQTTARFWQAGL